MKLDIEGFELHALRGARRTIERARPVIITEVNHCFLRYHPDFSPLTQFMGDVGYRCHALNGENLSPVNLGKDLSALPASDDANYWWMPINPNLCCVSTP
jgi:hypothetical protein